jgi:hypothetical protein
MIPSKYWEDKLLQKLGVVVMQINRIEQLSKLSSELINGEVYNADAKALGFFFRKANIKNIIRSYENIMLYPVGKVYIISPSNVDYLFAYNSLLAWVFGNEVYVKLPEKIGSNFQDIFSVVGLINKYCCGIRIDSLSRISQENMFHLRTSDAIIVWGGNRAVFEIRKADLKPTARIIAFPDRKSAALLNLSNAIENHIILRNFATDVLSQTQLACSSPSFLFVDDFNASKWQEFLSRLATYSSRFSRVGWYQQRMIRVFQNCQGENVYSHKGFHYEILTPDKLSDIVKSEVCGFGFFYIIPIGNFRDLQKISHYDEWQTLTYDHTLYSKNDLLGINFDGPKFIRLKKFGEALSFNHVWDGIDLVRSVCIEVND